MTEFLSLARNWRLDLRPQLATWNTELAGRRENRSKAIARRTLKLRSPLKTNIARRSRRNRWTGNKDGDTDAVHDRPASGVVFWKLRVHVTALSSVLHGQLQC